MLHWFKERQADVLPVTKAELAWAQETAKHNRKWEVYLEAMALDLEIRKLRAAGAEPDSVHDDHGTQPGHDTNA